MRRRASITVDIVAALAACALITGTVAEAAAHHRARQAEERRSAELEIAQNLLDDARRSARVPGATLPERAGWTWTRRALADGIVELRVRSERVSLATLIATAEAP